MFCHFLLKESTVNHYGVHALFIVYSVSVDGVLAVYDIESKMNERILLSESVFIFDSIFDAETTLKSFCFNFVLPVIGKRARF